MKWFKRINSGEIKNRVIKKQSLKGAILFVVGTLTSALSFNLFCVPNNFVSGGLGGVGIILNHFFSNININLVILLGNLLFIIISLFTLGFKESIMSIVGATVFTVFLYATTDIPELINFKFDNILLYVLGYGVASGFGESLVYKSGFNTGGTSILARILQKYISLPLGKILRYISIIIIFMWWSSFFGYTALMYSLIIMVISTSIVDKMLIGISDSKTFFYPYN
ncbi:MAG: YitT family protein [Clostridium sp.]|nr:MAG: YitT family protein [Clostridium sp.]